MAIFWHGVQGGRNHQEIATGLTALAMTAVMAGWSFCSCTGGSWERVGGGNATRPTEVVGDRGVVLRNGHNRALRWRSNAQLSTQPSELSTKKTPLR